jgi:hypothetical protein
MAARTRDELLATRPTELPTNNGDGTSTGVGYRHLGKGESAWFDEHCYHCGGPIGCSCMEGPLDPDCPVCQWIIEWWAMVHAESTPPVAREQAPDVE